MPHDGSATAPKCSQRRSTGRAIDSLMADARFHYFDLPLGVSGVIHI